MYVCGSLSWSCTSLLSLLSSDRKVVCHSKADKHGLIREPLTGAVFESVVRHTGRPATNVVHV